MLFQCFAIVNDAVVNRTPQGTRISLGQKLMDHGYGNIQYQTPLIHTSTSNAQELLKATSSLNAWHFQEFQMPVNWVKKNMFCCVFEFSFPHQPPMLNLFTCLLTIYVSALVNVIHFSYPLLHWVVCVILINLYEVFICS